MHCTFTSSVKVKNANMQTCFPDSEFCKRRPTNLLLMKSGLLRAAHPKINYIEIIHFFAYLLQKMLNKRCGFYFFKEKKTSYFYLFYRFINSISTLILFVIQAHLLVFAK